MYGLLPHLNLIFENVRPSFEKTRVGSMVFFCVCLQCCFCGLWGLTLDYCSSCAFETGVRWLLASHFARKLVQTVCHNYSYKKICVVFCRAPNKSRAMAAADAAAVDAANDDAAPIAAALNLTRSIITFYRDWGVVFEDARVLETCVTMQARQDFLA